MSWRAKHHSQAKHQLVKPNLHIQVKTQTKEDEKHLTLGPRYRTIKIKVNTQIEL